MEIHQLRYFVAAAEAGTISRAAERCRVAQPSLSQQLRKLEDAVGAPLFDRLGRGVALTDAGRALLPRARRILAEVRDIEDRLGADVAAGSGRLAIGAIPTMAPYVLPPLLARLRPAFPQCEVLVVEDLTEHLIEQLEDNRLDVAIMSTPVEHDRIALEVVGSEPMFVVAPAGHALGTLPSITLDQLRDQPTITLHDMHCLGRQISGFCAARRLARQVVCRTAQLATVLAFVGEGLGVSLVPKMAADHDTSDARVYLQLKRNPPTRQIALAHRTDRSRGVIVERIAELLREQLAEKRE